MPYKPKVPCRHPGCAELVEAGQKYCEEHKRMHSEEIRSAAARGYNSRWRRESKKFLQLVPHRGDQKLFWDKSNWQALCKKCHDRKTGREDSDPTYRY